MTVTISQQCTWTHSPHVRRHFSRKTKQFSRKLSFCPYLTVEPKGVDETPTVDVSRAVDGSQLKTTESTPKAVKTHLNVGAQAAGVMNDKSCHEAIIKKKVDNLRISKEKEFPMKSSETKKYVNWPCSLCHKTWILNRFKEAILLKLQ